jgi:dTDP-4-dehydrorhamnose reductase
MTYLIAGGDSNIGSKLSEKWIKECRPFLSSTRCRDKVSRSRPYLQLGKKIDFCCPEYVSKVVICIGPQGVEYCEHHPQETWLLNVEWLFEFVRHLSNLGCYVLYLSSSRVFDGAKAHRTVSDHINPITEYGKQKAQAEKRILSLGNSGILRLTKIIDEQDPLIESWKRALEKQREIFPFKDVFVSPVSYEEVGVRITECVEQCLCGISHLCAKETISYEELALRHCEIWGYDDRLIVPIRSPESNLYPRHSSLK